LIQKAMTGLCLIIIVLQFFDASTTFSAIRTGVLVEKNELLNHLAAGLSLPIEIIVVAAKFLVSFLFAWVMIKTKATLYSVAFLFLVASFYIHIVITNLHWVKLVG